MRWLLALVALERMLLKRPMVVGYKVNAITAFLARRLVKIPYVSLPNILAGQELVKELIQQECSVDNLYHRVNSIIKSDNQALLDKFTDDASLDPQRCGSTSRASGTDINRKITA
ncbi:hypothetical protein ACT691_07245 [Vibrio metschnikovii]